MSANPEQALIYHITDGENLPGILTEGGLRSDAVMAEKNPTVIGYGHIKERRLKQIWVACCGGRFVGEFVPFYFCPRSPMLYTTNKGATGRPVGCQRTILHLVSRVSVGGERRERGGVSHMVRLDVGRHQDAGLGGNPRDGLAGQDASEVGGVPRGGFVSVDGHPRHRLPQQRCGQAGAGFGKLSTPSSGCFG
jgi:hypothetical protein